LGFKQQLEQRVYLVIRDIKDIRDIMVDKVLKAFKVGRVNRGSLVGSVSKDFKDQIH
jgi:cystathionine beta-lyase family protein involved in aluminum resistance